ncbi:MAG: hypothetical protein AAF431_14625 [Pseudomonadota bacterium]
MLVHQWLTWLIKSQFVYAALGIAFNLVSLLVALSTGSTLTQNNPWLGIAVMLLVVGAAWLGHKQHLKLFAVCNLVLLPALTIAGVLRHVPQLLALDYSQALSSPLFYGFAINLFGVGVMLIGLAIAIRTLFKS